jgi:hypothetical protein
MEDEVEVEFEMVLSLPPDVARCMGKGRSYGEGEWEYLHCMYCERRLSPPRGDHQVHQVWIEPPVFKNGNCPLRIKSRDEVDADFWPESSCDE